MQTGYQTGKENKIKSFKENENISNTCIYLNLR